MKLRWARSRGNAPLNTNICIRKYPELLYIKRKQPFFITLPDKRPLAFAGLWEAWNTKGDSDAVYHSCTSITIDASESIGQIHQRMPAVLKIRILEQGRYPASRWPARKHIGTVLSICRGSSSQGFSPRECPWPELQWKGRRLQVYNQ